MNGTVLNCPACDRRWAVGTNVGDYERQALEQAACPHCGKHTLRCVAIPRPRGRGRATNIGGAAPLPTRP